MSVLIKGMEIPEVSDVGVVRAEIRMIDGEVRLGIMTGGSACSQVWTFYPLAGIPPHGRLIDVDYADECAYDVLELASNYLPGREAARAMQKIYQNAPTIIPADKEGK